MSTKSEKPISELTEVTMQQIKEMTDVSTIVGEPIKLDGNVTIIPISRVSYGFASGGSDLPSKIDKSLFGGGAGAGISIKPEGFLVVTGSDVKYIPAAAASDPVSNVITSIPSAFEKISSMFKKKTDDNSDEK